MKVSEFEEKIALTVFAGSSALNNQISGDYVSDLMSDVTGYARENQIWITLQTHQNVVTIASLRDLAAIIIVKGLLPEPSTVEHSKEEGFPLLVSKWNHLKSREKFMRK